MSTPIPRPRTVNVTKNQPRPAKLPGNHLQDRLLVEHLKGKRCELELINGRTVVGLLIDSDLYCLQIDDRLVYKSAVVSIGVAR